jgi:uncharacterized membrane protein
MWYAFFIFILILLLVDSIWVIGASKIHSNVIQSVQKSPVKVSLLAAILFYFLAALGYMLILRKLSTDTKSAFLYGMLLGLLMYGTFDLTNKAIFTDYPWTYTIADMTWGTICIGVVSAIMYKINV